MTKAMLLDAAAAHIESLERQLKEAQRQHVEWMEAHGKELEAALREAEELRRQNASFRAAQKACETCDAPTMAEVKELREALGFYAAEGSWQNDPAPDPAGTPIPWTAPIWGDEGQRARAALAEKGKP